MNTSSAFGPRCPYCGVVHLGADGLSIVCPKLVPVSAPSASPGWQCPVCGSVYSPSVLQCFGPHTTVSDHTSPSTTRDDEMGMLL